MPISRALLVVVVAIATATCSTGSSDDPQNNATDPIPRGKADDFVHTRQYEVLLTDPHCDVCTSADKDHLLETSRITRRVIELIDGAQNTIEVAQFTFSRREIEQALVRAHERGVDVRLAMNSGQRQGDNPSTRLKAAGLDVRFVEGKDVGSFTGLQHAKYMIVDDEFVLMGSNNWSSTGVSINEENTLVLDTSSDDPLLGAFECYFERMFEGNLTLGSECSTEEAQFTPGSGAWVMLRSEIRSAESSIDVLMHHLVFDDAVKELAKAAERGVAVRVVVNAVDREETEGSRWDRLRAAGGAVRYKRTNPDLFQFMHHKLGIFDGRVLLNGSGNWSGSAFFNNWEFFLRLEEPTVLEEFNGLFARLWSWSLTAASLDGGLTAREQDVEERRPFFGNLHAHYEAFDGDQMLDDGNLQREVDGELVDVDGETNGNNIEHAFEYARDRGQLDFMALSPHVVDDRPDDPPDIASMSIAGYQEIIAVAQAVTEESGGAFVALPAFEWSTNSAGNHVNILGSREIAKVERGDFATLYEGFLPARREEGDRAWLMFNHPRTFRHFEESLGGNWDQIFGINLTDIPNDSDRRKKFNDFGIDDFPPLSNVRQSWIDGEAFPDEATVRETVQNVARVTADHHRLIEVTVNRGTHFRSESPANPSVSEDEETGVLERFDKVGDWNYYLLNDWRLAPVASHDNHYANWGLGHTSRTVILAPELTESALIDAIGERAVYASEDENLEVRLYADDRVRAGGELRTIADSVLLQLFVEDPDFDGAFDVTVWGGTVSGDEVTAVARREITEGEWTTFEVATDSVGTHFFYVETHLGDLNRKAWTAPVWIVRQ